MKATIVAMLVFVGVCFSARRVGANDSFAEVAAGGIRFLNHTEIVLQREVLTIREDKVEVSYWFFNPTDKDITVPVAFPLLRHPFNPGYMAPSPTYDFSVTADGRPQGFKTITEAQLEGRNVTAEVQRAGLPLVDFRGWDGRDRENPFLRLSPAVRKQLVTRGLLDEAEAFPLWTASVTCVWDQLFRAGRITEVRPTYTPQTGKHFFGLEPADHGWSTAHFVAGCTPSIEEAVRPESQDGMIFQTWVAYTFTTTNNWKTPIGEFTLVVIKKRDETVVVCSDLPAPEVSADTVEVSIKDYVPASRDLTVYFLAVHGPDESPQAAR